MPGKFARERRSITPREFAIQLVRQLRQAGFVAYWAGGCVRDELLGRTPKDYDIATNATPAQVRQVLRNYRTLSVGQAFGVVIVVGPPTAGNIDVATFRRESHYSDGRRPDQVSFFSSPEEDAQRRDFTVNGLFFDPLENKVIDYVGGQDDLRLKIVRAIGNAHDRIAEDKLRMLRAIRIATVYDFVIDRDCWEAICQHAPEITQVSAERITEELRMTFAHQHRARGADLLVRSGLFVAILPEGTEPYQWMHRNAPSPKWDRTLKFLQELGQQPDATLGFAALFHGLHEDPQVAVQYVQQVGRRWKLSRREMELIGHAISHAALFIQADQQPWPRVQRVLAGPYAERLTQFARALARASDQPTAGVDFCERVLHSPKDQWDPPPLLTGQLLKQMGLRPGPVFKEILEKAREAQLERRIATTEEAVAFARQWIETHVSASQNRCANGIPNQTSQ